MARTVSATQARIHFGELMRQAVESHEPITVERDGQPQVVILSVEMYRRLKEAHARPAWQDALNEVRALRARLRAQRGGKRLPAPEDVIREMREERDARLASVP